MTARARKSKRTKKTLEEMTFFDHLDELRVSLFRAIGGLIVGMIVAYYFAPQLQELLLFPFRQQTNSTLALITPTEGFVVKLKISFVAGLFGTAPWIFYQLWRFVAPGLFAHERRMVVPVVLSSSLLFLTGAAFAAYVLPMATSFFLGFGTQEIGNFWSLGKYLDFALRMFLAFGIVFELPLLLYFLARFGIVTPQFLRTYRRHMYVGFLIAASIITPPDIFTQMVLSVPMVILYEASILLSVVARRRFEKASPLHDPDTERKDEAAGEKRRDEREETADKDTQEQPDSGERDEDSGGDDQRRGDGETGGA